MAILNVSGQIPGFAWELHIFPEDQKKCSHLRLEDDAALCEIHICICICIHIVSVCGDVYTCAYISILLFVVCIPVAVQ